MAALPWWRSGFLRLSGMFRDKQWQAAAGADMLHRCLQQATCPALFAPNPGGADPTRFFVRFQLKGLHCWVCHVRLRAEPAEQWEVLFREMMETHWELAMIDMTGEEQLEFMMASKFQKELQKAWHGTAKGLDAAIATDDVREAMSEVLLRNVLAEEDGSQPPHAKAASLWLADYLIVQLHQLDSADATEVLAGRIGWAAPPPAAEQSELPGGSTAVAA